VPYTPVSAASDAFFTPGAADSPWETSPDKQIRAEETPPDRIPPLDPDLYTSPFSPASLPRHRLDFALSPARARGRHPSRLPAPHHAVSGRTRTFAHPKASPMTPRRPLMEKRSTLHISFAPPHLVPASPSSDINRPDRDGSGTPPRTSPQQ
jgi:hypothetical protein